jgi:hypothetical protein
MALFDDASLVTTPNGYKAGTLYSIKPTSGAGDMTVVRATTATRVNSAGLIESVANNVPRIDYTNGSCPSILVEPQRTNLALYSQQFDDASWLKLNTTVTANAIVSPDGTTNADKLIASAGSSNKVIYQSIVPAGTSTVSVFAKAGEFGGILIGTGTVGAFFNLTTGQFRANLFTAPVSTSVTNYGNGWYRCSVTMTLASLDNLYIAPNDNVSTNFAITGNGTSGIYVWGCQAELGSYPTSYIPTTSAAVTRNADFIYKTGISALIGQTEGVVFIDFVWNQLTGTGNYPRIIELGNNSNNYIQLYSIAGTTSWGWDIYNGGVVQFTGSSTMALGHNKIAIGYKLNDMVIYKNGTLIASDATCTVPATNGLGICGIFDGTAGAQLSASVNLAVLFPTRLTNAELASLTTI